MAKAHPIYDRHYCDYFRGYVMFYKPIKLLRIFLPIFTLIFCFLPVSCVIYPELVEKGTKSPRAERCGDCHRDIYAEWKDSPHASSFINSAFREETNEYQFTFCIGCHAPETIFTNEKIAPRSVNREEGVNCNTCHLNDCKLSGPTPAHGPHPIAEKNPFFRTSELCGKCHISTFLAWQKSDTAEGRKTCQDCHMPAIKRKLIQDDPWQKIYPKRDGKQHLFSSLAMFHGNENLLKLSFIQVTRSEGKIKGVLELENTDIPHSVPTGDYGYREVIVTTELLDKTGQIIDLKKESLFIELKTALPYKGKKCVPFCFGWNENSSVIKATVIRTSFHKDRNILLSETIHKL
ncbi:MAG: putative heme protein [Candidatus Brocadia sinica]|nr:MAG: putative heme protein [Candidatus Brocadia sinica]